MKKTYKHTPAEVEAVQWNGANIGEMADFLGYTVVDGTVIFDNLAAPLLVQVEVANGAISFQLRTPHGDVQVRPSDYVVKSADSYTVTPMFEFESQYTEV